MVINVGSFIKCMFAHLYVKLESSFYVQEFLSHSASLEKNNESMEYILEVTLNYSFEEDFTARWHGTMV